MSLPRENPDVRTNSSYIKQGTCLYRDVHGSYREAMMQAGTIADAEAERQIRRAIELEMTDAFERAFKAKKKN